MTCIVGVTDGTKVVLGGDSAAVAGLDIFATSLAKVFNVGEFVMGYTDSFRMGQVLQHVFKPPVIGNQEIMKYMVTKFIPALRKCFKKAGFGGSGTSGDRGGEFLVGVRGRLFLVCSDYQVNEPMCRYMAVGCGGSFAVGSLASTTGKPQDRVQKALEVAAQWSAGVVGPFDFVSA